MYSPWRQTKLFPYLLPALSQPSLSFRPVFLIPSIARLPTHTGEEWHARSDARSLVICQRCQLGWRETSPPAYLRPLLYVRSNLGDAAPRITPDIKRSRSDHHSASQASHHGGETTTWPSFPLLETSLRSDSQWFKTWLITIKSTHKKKYNRITHLKKTSDLKKRHFEGVTSEQLISGTLSNKKTHLNPWKVNSSAAHCDLFAC